jgi:hypothetical protein
MPQGALTGVSQDQVEAGSRNRPDPHHDQEVQGVLGLDEDGQADEEEQQNDKGPLFHQQKAFSIKIKA